MKKVLMLLLVFSLIGITVCAATATFRLNWYAQGIHTPFFAAYEKGYYAEEGINLTIREGTGSGVTVRLVGNKSETFGFADAATAMLGIAQGIPIKIIAPIYAVNGFAIVTLADKGITTPKDLEGKRVAITPGDALTGLFPAVVQANNIDDSKITYVSMDAAAKPAALMAGRVDAILGGADDQAIRLEELGYDVVVLRFAEYGVPTIGLALLAHEDTIRDNPELVRAFLRATLKGWAEAYMDTEEIVSLGLPYMPDVSFPRALAEVQVALDSLFSPNSNVIGMPTTQDWERSVELLKLYGGLETDKPSTFFYDESVLPYWLHRKVW